MSETMSENLNSRNKFYFYVAEDLELLARLHAFELDEKMIEALKKSFFPQCLLLKPETDRPIYPVMEKAIAEIGSTDATLDLLASDFAAIYLNVSFEASPNESAWLDEDGLERQEPMFDVRSWYQKFGLEIENWRVRPDDNLSLQLLFIAHLFKQEKVSVKDINHFMDFHILRWVDEFAERIFARADTAFYSSLALLTAQYLNELREILVDLEGKTRPTKKEIQDSTRKEEAPFVYDPLFYSSQNGGW